MRTTSPAAAMRTVAAFAMREAVRRRIFAVVLALTVAFLVLYAVGCWQAFGLADDVGTPVPGVDPTAAVGATIFGLAMFATLFLGCVLAVFLTLGVVRGDAERGLLQPLLVRPLTRAQLLLARAGAAAAVAAAYVVAVYCAATLLTGAIGGWWPDRLVTPALALALAVVILAALSVAGSAFLSGTVNGIAVFMLFGAGLVLGLLGQIAGLTMSATLDDIARIGGYVLPFEALYRLALSDITAETFGVTRLVVNLGLLGGAQDAGIGLWLWAVAYLGLVTAGAAWAFGRRDL